MAAVRVGSAVQRHVRCAPCEVAGETVGEVLERLFARVPRLRGYVVDDQGRPRQHIAIFLDGTRLEGDDIRDVPVGDGARVHIMQALSGG